MPVAGPACLWFVDGMKSKRIPRLLQAFTRLDLAVLLAVLAMLAGVVLPCLANPWSRSLMVECANNLRRIGQGFHVWASDHGDMFPWSVPVPQGGVVGLEPYKASQCFIAISNELRTPSFLVCPTDAAKVRVNRFDPSLGYPRDENVSYFAGTLASMTHGRTWLSGDRNVNPGTSPSPGWLVIYPGSLVKWDATLHAYAGNLLRADGSVHQLTQTGLMQLAAQAAAQNTNGLIEILRP